MELCAPDLDRLESVSDGYCTACCDASGNEGSRGFKVSMRFGEAWSPGESLPKCCRHVDYLCDSTVRNQRKKSWGKRGYATAWDTASPPTHVHKESKKF